MGSDEISKRGRGERGPVEREKTMGEERAGKKERREKKRGLDKRVRWEVEERHPDQGACLYKAEMKDQEASLH